MRKDPDTHSQFVEIIDSRVYFAALQGADVGSLQSALEAQFLLGPTKQ